MVTVLDQRIPLYEGKQVTFEEYMNLPDDSFQYEIVEGIMKMSPAPFDEHQTLIWEISGLLYIFLKENPIGKAYSAPRDVKFSETITRQPDILFISNDRLNIKLQKYVDGAPDFIIEVLSKGTLSRDVKDKYLEYERFGVKEYWIMNPNSIETSEFYYLEEGKYKPFYPDNNIIHSKVITGFSMDLDKLESYL